jgi:hypothetical protein
MIEDSRPSKSEIIDLIVETCNVVLAEEANYNIWPEYPRDACSYICEHVWDRLELSLVAGWESWFMGYELTLESGIVILGNTEADHTWLQLEDVIIDPTASQFWGLPWLWIIHPGDPHYHLYKGD